MGKKGARLNVKRLRAVRARLKEGYTAEQLNRACDGCALTPHNMGENDRHERYDDLELICRDGSHVERFQANAENPPRQGPKPAQRPPCLICSTTSTGELWGVPLCGKCHGQAQGEIQFNGSTAANTASVRAWAKTRSLHGQNLAGNGHEK